MIRQGQGLFHSFCVVRHPTRSDILDADTIDGWSLSRNFTRRTCHASARGRRLVTALKTLAFVFIFTILLRHLEVEVFENLRKSFAELGPHRVRPAGDRKSTR